MDWNPDAKNKKKKKPPVKLPGQSLLNFNLGGSPRIPSMGNLEAPMGSYDMNPMQGGGLPSSTPVNAPIDPLSAEEQQELLRSLGVNVPSTPPTPSPAPTNSPAGPGPSQVLPPDQAELLNELVNQGRTSPSPGGTPASSPDNMYTDSARNTYHVIGNEGLANPNNPGGSASPIENDIQGAREHDQTPISTTTPGVALPAQNGIPGGGGSVINLGDVTESEDAADTLFAHGNLPGGGMDNSDPLTDFSGVDPTGAGTTTDHGPALPEGPTSSATEEEPQTPTLSDDGVEGPGGGMTAWDMWKQNLAGMGSAVAKAFRSDYEKGFDHLNEGQAAAMNAVNQQVAGLGRGANEMGALGGHAFGGGAQAGAAQAALAGAGLQQQAIADYANKRTDLQTGLAKNYADIGSHMFDTAAGFGSQQTQHDWAESMREWEEKLRLARMQGLLEAGADPNAVAGGSVVGGGGDYGGGSWDWLKYLTPGGG